MFLERKRVTNVLIGMVIADFAMFNDERVNWIKSNIDNYSINKKYIKERQSWIFKTAAFFVAYVHT